VIQGDQGGFTDAALVLMSGTTTKREFIETFIQLTFTDGVGPVKYEDPQVWEKAGMDGDEFYSAVIRAFGFKIVSLENGSMTLTDIGREIRDALQRIPPVPNPSRRRPHIEPEQTLAS
jgi:hypothetical protein